MLEVLVGLKRKKFIFHKNLICSQSPFFQGLCTNDMREKQISEYYLPEDDPQAFELLTYYVYRQALLDDYCQVCDTGFRYLPIIKFYILCDKLLLANEAKVMALSALAKARFDNIKDCGDLSSIAHETVNRVLLSTAEDCPMREMVMKHVWQSFLLGQDSSYLTGCFDNIPVEEVCKCMEFLKDTAASGTRSKTPPSLMAAERGQSIADRPDYQVGFLKGSSSD